MTIISWLSSWHALLVPVAVLFVLSLFFGVAPDRKWYGSEHKLLLYAGSLVFNSACMKPKHIQQSIKCQAPAVLFPPPPPNLANDLFSLIISKHKSGLALSLSVKGALIYPS